MRFGIKASFKTLINLGLVVLLGFCLLSMVACSTDDLVSDIVDIDVDASADLQPTTVTVTKTAATATGTRGVTNCETTNINSLLDEVESEIEDQFGYDFDLVSIESITLDYLYASYTATWTPSSITSIQCNLTINDDLVIAANVDTSNSGMREISLTETQIAMINTYLADRSADFTYCVSCSDDPDTYTINYTIEMGVTIHGNI